MLLLLLLLLLPLPAPQFSTGDVVPGCDETQSRLSGETTKRCRRQKSSSSAEGWGGEETEAEAAARAGGDCWEEERDCDWELVRDELGGERLLLDIDDDGSEEGTEGTSVKMSMGH